MSAAPVRVPAELAGIIGGYQWVRDTIGLSGTSVYRLEAPDRPTLYLKHATGESATELAGEAARLEWLGRYLPVPRVLKCAASPGETWLAMTAVPGITAFEWLEANPGRQREAVTTIADRLRALHAIPTDVCPFDSTYPLRLVEARRRMETGLVDVSQFDGEHEGWMPEQVWDELTALPAFTPDLVVTHGDCTLDNILIEDGRVTGCIDLGLAGIADRWQDLAILWSDLGEFDADLQQHFLTAYGIAEPDRLKIKFHLSLYEFF